MGKRSSAYNQMASSGRPVRPAPPCLRKEALLPGRERPRAHLLAAPAPVALRRTGRGGGEGGGAEAAAAAPGPGPARHSRATAAAAPACAVMAEDLALGTLLPHGGRRGLAHAAGGLQAQRHAGRLGRPPRAQRHGNGGRLHGPPKGRPATSATGRARSEVLGRPRRDPAATADPWRREAGSRSPGPGPGAGPPAGHAGPTLGAASRESQLGPGGPYPGRTPPPGSRGRPRPCLRPPGLPAMGGAPGAGRGRVSQCS